MNQELSGVNKLKILSCYKEIKEILKGNIPVPRTVEIFPSDKCNHNCIGCHSAMLHHNHPPFLKLERAKEIINEIAKMGVESIEISGGGESLLHPNIIEFIQYIKKSGMKCGMFTNGIPITKKMLPTLTNDLLFLRIALDAGTRETYKRVRGVDDFFKLIQNIKELVDYRKKHKGKVTIGLKYLIRQMSEHEIIEGTKLAKKLKVDYIQFKALRNSPFGIKNPKHVQMLIDRAKELSTDKFQVLGNVHKSKLEKRCILNILHPVIDTSGDVYLCAFFQHRMNTHKIGNVYKQNFMEIWYSKRHRETFENTDIKQCNLFDCPFHPANKIVQEAIIKGKMHMEFI